MKSRFWGKGYCVITEFLHSDISIVCLFNILLAAVAFIKDILMASYLGTTLEADALFMAYFILDTLGNNLMASVVGISCIPVFARLYQRNRMQDLRKSVTYISVICFCLFIGLFCVLFVFAKPAVGMLAQGLSREGAELPSRLMKIILPMVLFLPAIVISTSLLQVGARFKVSAAAPVLFNCFLLTGVLYCNKKNVSLTQGVYILALSIPIGTAVMAIWVTLPAFRDIMLGIERRFTFKTEWIGKETSQDVKKFFKIFFPYLLILASNQLILFVERYIASFFGSGGISALTYSYRLVQFPIWVFVAAIGTVLFPEISRLSVENDRDKFGYSFQNTLFVILLITIPASVILHFLCKPVVFMLFFRGNFDSGSLKMTTDILAGYAIAIVGQSILLISVRFYAVVCNMKTPLIISMITAAVNILIDFYMSGSLGLKGLGYGAAISAVLNALLIVLHMWIKMKPGAYLKKNQLKRLAYINIPAAAFVAAASKVWGSVRASETVLNNALFVFLVLVIYAGILGIGIKNYKFNLRGTC